MGFSTTDAKVPWADGFMAPIAGRVRAETGLPVGTAWGLDKPAVAERALAEGQLDLVMIGRAHLANPHYAFPAGRELGVPKAASVLPDPYAYWLSRYPGPQNGNPVD